MKRKILAFVLALVLLAGIAAVPAAAKESVLPEAVSYGAVGAVQSAGLQAKYILEDVKDIAALPLGTLFSIRGFFIVIDKLVTRIIQVLLTAIESFIPPARAREDYGSYTSENFLEGYKTFENKTGKFSLGYDARSILPEDFREKGYRMGGYDFNKIATDAHDEIKVRTVVIDDGTGRGAVAIAVLDVIGLANEDVRSIRAKLSSLTDDGTLVSINVATSHTHSSIDSLGLWGSNPLQLVPTNFAAAFVPSLVKPMMGVDETFLNTMVNQTADSIRAALNNREKGELYFAKKNTKEYLRDVIDPYVMEENLYRLRFEPDDSNAKQTIIANFSAHPERVGMITGDNPGDVVSADFVPYIEEVINKDADANFLFLQGPIGTRITAELSPATKGVEGLNRLEGTQYYGRAIGKVILGMDGEEKLDPVLNIAHTQLLAEVENPLLKAVGKLWLANNKMIVNRKTGQVYTLTEIGYMELGNLKFLLQPGETSPELLLGGSNLTAEGSVTGKAYSLAPLRESIPGLIVLDLMNDSIGYIIPDNDSTNLLVRYIDGELTDEKSIGSNLNDALLLTFSTKIASTLGNAFLALVESVG